MESVPKFGDRSPPRNGWGLSEVWADNVDHVSRRSQMIIQVVAGDAAFFYRGAHFVTERGQIQPFVDCPRGPPRVLRAVLRRVGWVCGHLAFIRLVGARVRGGT